MLMFRMRLVKDLPSQFIDNGCCASLEKWRLRKPCGIHGKASSCHSLNLRCYGTRYEPIPKRLRTFISSNGGEWQARGAWATTKRRCSSLRTRSSSVYAHAGGHHAKPLHPRATNVLYLMYLGTCLVERTWRFALPLVLAFVEGRQLLRGIMRMSTQAFLNTAATRVIFIGLTKLIM